MKICKKIPFIAILLLLISCEGDIKNIDITGDVLMGLAERFKIGSEKVFSMRFVTRQNCQCMYEGEFLYRYHKLGNSLYFDLVGIEVPEDCNDEYGSPFAEIDLGILSNGIYSIQVNLGSHNNSSNLTISDTAFSVTMIKSENVQLMWGNFRRVFNNTLWGGFCYNTDIELSKGLSLIDSLNTLGVQPSTLEDGDYLFFSKQGNKVDLKMSQYVPRYYFNKEIGFVFNYDFNDQKIMDLMTKFKYTDGDFYIKIATGKGTNLYNWR